MKCSIDVFSADMVQRIMAEVSIGICAAAGTSCSMIK